MNIDLELYRVFYVTARAGNISKAAAELFISQPAVSYSIKKLEEALGSPLFIRKPRGVELTAEAKLLYAQVEEAFQLLTAAQEDFLQNTHPAEHEIQMSTTEIFTHFSPISYLRDFQAAHPKTRICLSNHGTPKALSMLREGTLDLAIITLPVADMKGLKVQTTLPLHDCFVVGKRFRHLAKQPISLRELARNPLLILRPGLNTRRFLDHFAASCGVDIRPQMELENIDSLIRCAVKGYGVSFVVREMVEEELADGQLFLVPLKEQIPPRSIGLCSRRHPENPEVQRFIRGFVDFVEQNQDTPETPG